MSNPQEMADQAAAAAPLRRRAALVLAKWVPKLRVADRPPAYGALLQLLAVPDAAVQLSAISALQVPVMHCRTFVNHFNTSIGHMEVPRACRSVAVVSPCQPRQAWHCTLLDWGAVTGTLGGSFLLGDGSHDC